MPSKDETKDAMFQEDLKKVFQERVDDMSNDLVGMLRELWEEGRNRFLPVDFPNKRFQEQSERIKEQMFQGLGISPSAMSSMTSGLNNLGKEMKRSAGAISDSARMLNAQTAFPELTVGGVARAVKPKPRTDGAQVVGTVQGFKQKVKDSHEKP